MKKVAIYGKGGIGKSTITSALSAALSTLGYKVLQIGCDPKEDSTISLLGGKKPASVMSCLKNNINIPTLDEIVQIGFRGVICVESGGPTPGLGCAGRGIIAAFNLLEELNIYEIYKPDIVFYDVLGDVVCGGFAAPIREGYAEEVIIITSGEKMALFAADNINTAVKNFEERGYAKVRGIILNRRNVVDEEIRVKEFAKRSALPIIGDIPRDDSIQKYENMNKTVIEGDITLPVSQKFLALASSIVSDMEVAR